MGKKEKQVFGRCPMCHSDGARLIRSHLCIMRWGYKRLSRSWEGNQNPMVVENGKAEQTSKQEKEHLLCEPCDNDLGKSDGWASLNLWQSDGTTPLVDRSRRVEHRIHLSDEDAFQLSRFCISVFWRAHVSQSYDLSLGPYGDLIRRWLLNPSLGLPREVVVMTSFIAASPGEGDLGNFASTPMSGRREGYRIHNFMQFGLNAVLAVGQVMPPSYREDCLVQGATKTMQVTAAKRVLDLYGPVVAEAARRRVQQGLEESF